MQVVGIDSGGTFTDLACYDSESGSVRVSKVASTPKDPATAVRAVIQGGAPGATGSRMVHGTTVATNALLASDFARMAIVTTQGFRDLLEIGRTQRAGRAGLFDTKFVKRPPMVPRSRRFEVDERIMANGSVLRELREDDIRRLIQALDAVDPEVVVICLLHSYINPSHEQQVASLVREHFSEAVIVLSSDVVSEYQEYERLSTTVINGSVLPRVDGYFKKLEVEAKARSSDLYVMGSNGGIMTPETAERLPARTIFSGPAGGVNGALLACGSIGVDDFITCDMGGTSADVSLVKSSTPAMVQESMIAALPLKLPQLDIQTVGAGGGSIAWLDVDGSLHVGPRSAGSEPGPVCYGRGGTEPTVTDADLVLGRIGQDSLLDGSMHIDRAAAESSLTRLAGLVGYRDALSLAEGVVRLAVAKMVSAIREISMERGHDPRSFTLVAFGGAGPLHAAEIATELGMKNVLIPLYPGNLSAVGLTCADLRYDYATTFHSELTERAVSAAGARFAELEARGRSQLLKDSFDDPRTHIERVIDMRYRGQAFELGVTFDPNVDDEASLVEKFHAQYAERYGIGGGSEPVELVTLRLTATGIVGRPELNASKNRDVARHDNDQYRPIFYKGRNLAECPVVKRETLQLDSRFEGPLIIEEFGSTTFLPPRWTCVVDSFGNLRLDWS